MGYIGLTQTHSIAIEYDEFGDERLRASISAAETAVDNLVEELVQNLLETADREPALA